MMCEASMSDLVVMRYGRHIVSLAYICYRMSEYVFRSTTTSVGHDGIHVEVRVLRPLVHYMC